MAGIRVSLGFVFILGELVLLPHVAKQTDPEGSKGSGENANAYICNLIRHAGMLEGPTHTQGGSSPLGV